ncbi:MAG: riboflavin biosynthesis protein RibF, partial [Deltaproteobacteria bacterium]
NYQVCGIVVKGKNRGARILGYPTANLRLIDELTPKIGVYAVRVLVDDKVYNGVANIGYNPTFGNGVFSVETHILDFKGELLGKEIRIDFIRRLRDEKRFKDPVELAGQISKDVEEAKKILEGMNAL